MDKLHISTSKEQLVERLYQASWHGNTGEVVDLLHKGADPNSLYYQRIHQGYTPLHRACGSNQSHTAELLIKWGARVNTINQDGETPLHYVSSLKCAELLLNEHCLRGMKNNNGRTAVELARRREHTQIAEFISNYSPRPRDPLSGYPSTEELNQLQCNQWIELGLKFKLSQSDLDSFKDKHNPTASTLIAIKIQDIDMRWKHIVKGLLIVRDFELAKTVCQQQEKGHNLLSVCAFYGWIGTLKDLVETEGLDPNRAVNTMGLTPLYFAYQSRQLKVIKYLVQKQQCNPKIVLPHTAGETPLSLECSHGDLEMIKALINKHIDPNKPVDKAGNTPLHLACGSGHLELAKFFINVHKCHPDTKMYRTGITPLSLACANGHLDMAKYLMDTHHCDPKCIVMVNKKRETPLSLAYANKHVETIKYLIQEKKCDPNFEVNEMGDTPLSLACLRGDLEMIMILINELIDAKGPARKDGETPICLAMLGGHWDVVKYFVETHHCRTNDCLLRAAENNLLTATEKLLAEYHSDPDVRDEDGNTPLTLTNSPTIVTLLLRHGAKADNVYKAHSKIIGSLSAEQPPAIPLSVFIIGDGGVGKSTLLKSMFASKGILATFKRARPVSGVDQRTVGIIPYEIVTRSLGRILCYDFAGQQEFYASHCAVLENAVQTSPPIIIHCIDLQESEHKISDSTKWWMTLIQNQCTNLKRKAHVIVVGTHADKLKENGEIPQQKEGIFAPIIIKFPKFKFISFTPMDCRFPDSDGMKDLKKSVQNSSVTLRSSETVTFNAHTFYIYLLDSFKEELAISIKDVQHRIQYDLDQEQSKRMRNLLSFIPSSLPHLLKICDQLNKKGLILFLHNKDNPENSFLVCDRTTLLSTVTGTVFAPEGFRQHCSLASSTGVVPLSKFSKEFQGINIEMLVAFMSHLEFCFEIEDKDVLEYIAFHGQGSTLAADIDSRYLFFPGLIRINIPKRVWENSPQMRYHFGWMLECSQDIEFFDSRCFQVLILRLVFIFRLAPAEMIHEDIPSLQRFCSVWKSGICWCDDDGLTTYLELSENGKSFVLKIRCKELTSECLFLRTKVIKKVIHTVKDFCPNVVAVESIIDPSQVVVHPHKEVQDLTLCSIQSTAQAVVSNREMVKSMYQPQSLKSLLGFEPYAGLDQDTLQCIHSDRNVMKHKKISNAFISHFANQVTNPHSPFIYGQILSPSRASAQPSSPQQELVQALKTWRSETEGTYSCLKETLNTYSIFSGRNPLDIASMDHSNCEPFKFVDDDIILFDPQADLNLEKHLEIIKYEIWELRAKWSHFGLQLGISPGTLDAIEMNNRLKESFAEECFTATLTYWLSRTSPPPTWTELIEAIKSPPVAFHDIANKLEGKLNRN